MAYLDREAAKANKERLDAYNDLKSELAWRKSLKNAERTWDQQMGELNLSSFERALEYLDEQEREAAAMKARIKEYEQFFSKLRDLTPRSPSIHDIIY